MQKYVQRYTKFPNIQIFRLWRHLIHPNRRHLKTKATATSGQSPSRTYIIMDCSTL